MESFGDALDDEAHFILLVSHGASMDNAKMLRLRSA